MNWFHTYSGSELPESDCNCVCGIFLNGLPSWSSNMSSLNRSDNFMSFRVLSLISFVFGCSLRLHTTRVDVTCVHTPDSM